MPAIERAVDGSDLPPARLYLDADFILNALVSTEYHHDPARRLLERAKLHGLTTLYVSSLVFLEVAHSIRESRFHVRKLSAAARLHFQLDRWSEQPVRERFFQEIFNSIDTLLSNFGWFEIMITPAIRMTAVQLMAVHDLDSHDATHLACMYQEEVLDLASFDADFRRVNGLYLWNDLIHAGKPIP